MGLTGWESNDDYERYVTMYDALTYKDMFVSLDLLSNNMSGQQCMLPLLPHPLPACLPSHTSEIFCRLRASHENYLQVDGRNFTPLIFLGTGKSQLLSPNFVDFRKS